MSLACLPWYDLVETQSVTDRLWYEISNQLTRLGLLDIPGSLDRRADYEAQWRSPDLLLGQACGYDVYCANDQALQVVGAPVYDLPGCVGSSYRSFVVVRDNAPYQTLNDLRGARCVINSPRSHSGMNVLQALMTPLAVEGRFFSEVTISGAHERSLEHIFANAADVAAIDCITYGLLQKHRPEALRWARIIHQTPTLKAPPYVTGANTPTEIIPLLFQAIAGGIEELKAREKRTLGLRGIESVTLSSYEEMATIQRRAVEASYLELCG